MPQSVFSWCFLSVSKYFLPCSTSGPRTGFLSWEPDFQRILKKPQNMFSWCFLSVSRYFSIVRNLCWEPHFWAENRIFKNFSKSLKTCFVGVFWVFQCIFFSIVRHLSREPEFLSREPDFQEILENPQNMLSWCFLGVSCFFSIVRHLRREPDFF